MGGGTANGSAKRKRTQTNKTIMKSNKWSRKKRQVAQSIFHSLSGPLFLEEKRGSGEWKRRQAAHQAEARQVHSFPPLLLARWSAIKKWIEKKWKVWLGSARVNSIDFINCWGQLIQLSSIQSHQSIKKVWLNWWLVDELLNEYYNSTWLYQSLLQWPWMKCC